jgi:hypothetical protein
MRAAISVETRIAVS